MECWLCIRSQKDGFYKEVDCKGIDYVEECPRPTDKVHKFPEECRRFRFLFNRMVPGLFRSDGNFDFGAIDSVFDAWKVSAGQRTILHDQVLAIIGVIQESRQASSGIGEMQTKVIQAMKGNK